MRYEFGHLMWDTKLDEECSVLIDQYWKVMDHEDTLHPFPIHQLERSPFGSYVNLIKDDIRYLDIYNDITW